MPHLLIKLYPFLTTNLTSFNLHFLLLKLTPPLNPGSSTIHMQSSGGANSGTCHVTHVYTREHTCSTRHTPPGHEYFIIHMTPTQGWIYPSTNTWNQQYHSNLQPLFWVLKTFNSTSVKTKMCLNIYKTRT